jgi:hypothetical protein
MKVVKNRSERDRAGTGNRGGGVLTDLLDAEAEAEAGAAGVKGEAAPEEGNTLHPLEDPWTLWSPLAFVHCSTTQLTWWCSTIN